MKDITEQLGMSRNTLVALALLLGCDYVPKGVPGVGKVHAVQLVQRLAGRDILKRFQSWSKETSEGEHDLKMRPVFLLNIVKTVPSIKVLSLGAKRERVL